jgi:hypothetical protein
VCPCPGEARKIPHPSGPSSAVDLLAQALEGGTSAGCGSTATGPNLARTRPPQEALTRAGGGVPTALRDVGTTTPRTAICAASVVATLGPGGVSQAGIEHLGSNGLLSSPTEGEARISCTWNVRRNPVHTPLSPQVSTRRTCLCYSGSLSTAKCSHSGQHSTPSSTLELKYEHQPSHEGPPVDMGA